MNWLLSWFLSFAALSVAFMLLLPLVPVVLFPFYYAAAVDVTIVASSIVAFPDLRAGVLRRLRGIR